MLLRRGASQVVAADVGRGLLVWRLQTDDRVTVLDKTNVRALTPEQTGGPVDLVVADLSFISLRLVLPALLSCMTEDADLLPMVKPQFEVGKERLGSGGVVRDPELRADAVRSVLTRGRRTGAAAARRGRQPASRTVGKCRILRMATSWEPSRRRSRNRSRGDRRSRGAAMTAREVLLVVHTGRADTRQAAEKVAGWFADAGIKLRVLEREAPELDRSCYQRVVPVGAEGGRGHRAGVRARWRRHPAACRRAGPALPRCRCWP